MLKKTTSLKQKLFLLIFSLLLTFVLLEISLRIAGAVVLNLQERHNHLSFNPNEYRILCLGESTTALGGEDAYPSQLEVLLNAQSRQKKFTVINKGIISTTTDYILAHAEENLDAYKPQMVIIMMGINDKAFMHDPNKSLWQESIKSWLSTFRVIKLGYLLYEHITHRMDKTNPPSGAADLPNQDDDYNQVTEDFLKAMISKGIERYSIHMSSSNQYKLKHQFSQAQQEEDLAQQAMIETSLVCVELARRYRLQGLYPQALNFLKHATLLNPKLADAYQEWGEFYLAQQQGAESVKAFQASLELDPSNSDVILGLARAYHQEHNDNAFIVYNGYLQVKTRDYWGYIELSQWLREDKHYDLAQGYLNHAIEIEPDFDQAYVDLGQILDDQGQYQKVEMFFLNEIKLHPKNSRLFQALGKFYQNQGREDLAKEYFQKSLQQEVSDYYPATFVNYSLLLNKILNRHIKVLVMQYPLRDITPLKEYLGQRNDIIFVENKKNFTQALKVGGYNRYFKDNFAYDFGHCTRKGNELIAKNLTEVILQNE